MRERSAPGPGHQSPARFRKTPSATKLGPRPLSIRNPADLSSTACVRVAPDALAAAGLDAVWLEKLIAEAQAKHAQGWHYEPLAGTVNPLKYFRVW